MAKEIEEIAFMIRGFYSPTLTTDDESPRVKAQRLRAIQDQVTRDIEQRRVAASQSLGHHKDEFLAAAARNEKQTKGDLGGALAGDPAAQVKSVTEAMQKAFESAIQPKNIQPNFNDLRNYLVDTYQKIINTFEAECKDPNIGPETANKNFARRLVQMRNIVDYGFPDEIKGFADLVTSDHPYYSAWQATILEINSALNEIDKKANEYAALIAKDFGSDTAINTLQLLKKSVEASTITEAFNKPNDPGEQNNDIYKYFNQELDKAQKAINQIISSTKTDDEKKQELADLYLACANAAYAATNRNNNLKWDETAKAAKEQAAKQFALLSAELESDHTQLRNEAIRTVYNRNASKKTDDSHVRISAGGGKPKAETLAPGTYKIFPGISLELTENGVLTLSGRSAPPAAFGRNMAGLVVFGASGGPLKVLGTIAAGAIWHGIRTGIHNRENKKTGENMVEATKILTELAATNQQIHVSIPNNPQLEAQIIRVIELNGGWVVGKTFNPSEARRNVAERKKAEAENPPNEFSPGPEQVARTSAYHAPRLRLADKTVKPESDRIIIKHGH